MPEVDWVAVIAATVATFIVGGLWYSPLLFASSWQNESGVPQEQPGAPKMGLIWVAGVFGVNYLFERRSFKL